MSKKYISLIFFSAVYLFLSFTLYQTVSNKNINNPHRDIDSIEYEERAISFAKTNKFVENNKLSGHLQQPIGYPLFLGTIYKIFGQKDINIILIQILLMLLAGILIFFAANHIFGQTVGLIAHGLFCINVGTIVFPQFILSETLLLFLLVLSIERLFYFIKTESLYALVTSFFVMGLSTTVKPSALYYVLPLIVISLTHYFHSIKKIKLYNKYKHSKYVLLAIFAFMTPYIIHSIYVEKSFGGTGGKDLGNYHLYTVFWATVETDKHDPKNFNKKNEIFQKIKSEKEQLIITNSDGSKNWSKIRSKFIDAAIKEPFIFAKTWIKEMTKTYIGLQTTDLKVLVEPETIGGQVSFFFTRGSIFKRALNYISMGTKSIYIKSIGIYEVSYGILKYIFALIALILLFIRKKWLLLLIFTSYIFYFALTTGFGGCSRYRIMFDFMLIILAALGISKTIRRVSYRDTLRDDFTT